MSVVENAGLSTRVLVSSHLSYAHLTLLPLAFRDLFSAAWVIYWIPPIVVRRPRVLTCVLVQLVGFSWHWNFQVFFFLCCYKGR
jgi:hypothetical protein